MPKVKFIEFNGTEHEVEAAVGESIMAAATGNLVPGNSRVRIYGNRRGVGKR